MKHFIIGITGASGSIYGIRLAEELCRRDHRVDMIITNAGRQVIKEEMGIAIVPSDPSWTSIFADTETIQRNLVLYDMQDWNAPIASGSVKRDAMIIIPCSMGTLSAVAVGTSDNLLERAADVSLKEGRKLIVVPRESPFSTLHLRNMLTLSEMGVKVIPANPGFYHHPQNVMDIVNFTVSRVLDQLNVPNELMKRWGPEDESI